MTDHRKHHALSDQEGDPHSPHVGHGEGAWGALRGFVHAHVGWMFTNMGMEQGRLYGKDLYEDRLVRTIDRLYVLWVVATLGIPFRQALWVEATVISVSPKGWFVADCGLKALGMDHGDPSVDVGQPAQGGERPLERRVLRSRGLLVRS